MKFFRFLKHLVWGLPGIVLAGLYHALAVYFVEHGLFKAAIDSTGEAIQRHDVSPIVGGYLKYVIETSSQNIFLFVVLPFLGSFIVFTVIIAGRRYMLSNGQFTIEGKSTGRLSIISLLSLFNPVGHLRAIKLLHDFHHVYHKHLCIIDDLPNKKNLPLDTPAVQVAIDDLLIKAKEILDSVLWDDVSVHIKLFENTGVHELCYAERELSHLRAYRRNPSYREVEKRKGGTRSRNQVELFASEPDTKLSDMEDLKRAYPRKDKGDRLRISTAYNYVLQPNEHKFFVCNDLKRAENEGLFYSNSDNWEDYYSSLGVFLIWEPGGGIAHVGKAKRKPLGMLIIDSYSKGRFDRWRLRAVAGLLSHHFYDFFTAISASYKAGRTVAPPSSLDGRGKRKKI